MFEQQNLKRDLLAVSLLALTVFLGFALFSYNAADPVPALVRPLDSLYQADAVVYPVSDETTNACGPWGALAADLLFTGLGTGAYYLLVSLAALDVHLLRRRRVGTPLLRLTGWIASLAGLTAVASIVMPSLSPGPVIGAGGYLGALGRGLLEMHFATFGGLILAVSLVLGGLLLCTDYTLVKFTHKVFTLVRGGVLAVCPRSTKKRKNRARPKDDLTTVETSADVDEGESESDEESDEEADEVPIRIRGKAADEGDGTDDQIADEGDADAADEGPAEEEDAEPVVRRRVAPTRRAASAPHFRIRGRGSKIDREKVMNQLDEAARNDEPGDYQLPSINLLLDGDQVSFDEQEKEVRRKAKILEKTFAEFGFQVRVVEIETGPVIAQYEVQLEAGLRLSKITGLAEDLAIALRVPSVRIVAPIPGKNTVGIEVPNEHRQIVRLREVMEEAGGKTCKMRIPLFLGKDVSGNALTVDLSTLPHLLIAGRTGTGKSVCLNAIISSILMTKRPDEVRMLMIDPKMVELSGYGRLPHLMHPVVTDMRKAEAILAWAVEKMEERYSLLARAGVRHVGSYNQLDEEELMRRLQPETDEEREGIPLHLPFIVIVADEMADLMMTAGKEVEQHIIRLAQKSRAVGIHLIMATQKPTVDVITGLIKSNLPARIAFQVASRTDSRVVLDEMGADKLLGNGDMLFLWPGTSNLLRGQGTYMSDDEIESVTAAVSTGEQNFVSELVNLQVEEPGGGEVGVLKKRDDLYESAVDVVVREGRGSVSLLQRTLGIGYGRAARLIDFMAEDGIVAPYAGSQAREVLIGIADWERMQGYDPDQEEEPAIEAAPARKRPKKTKVVPQAEDNSLDAGHDAEWDDGEDETVDVEGYEDAGFDDEEEYDEYNMVG